MPGIFNQPSSAGRDQGIPIKWNYGTVQKTRTNPEA